jgi:hypothetical protein
MAVSTIAEFSSRAGLGKGRWLQAKLVKTTVSFCSVVRCKEQYEQSGLLLGVSFPRSRCGRGGGSRGSFLPAPILLLVRCGTGASDWRTN